MSVTGDARAGRQGVAGKGDAALAPFLSLAVEHRIYIDRESTLGIADEGARALQDCLKCSQEWERQTWHTRVQPVGRC